MRAVAYDNTCIGYKKMECFRRLVDNISMQFCESNDRTQAQKRRPSHKHFKHIDIRLTEWNYIYSEKMNQRLRPLLGLSWTLYPRVAWDALY